MSGIHKKTMAWMLLSAAILLAGACSGGGGSEDATEDQADATPDPDAVEQDAAEQPDPRTEETPGEVMDQADPAPDGNDAADDDGAEDAVEDQPADVNLDSDALTPAERCVSTGGTVTTGTCCLATGDFPNMCGMGPCSCAPEYSHEVQICQCAEGCFNGTECWLE